MPQIVPSDNPSDSLRDTMFDIQRKYLSQVRDPLLQQQYLERLVKSGKVQYNPQTQQIGVQGLGNEPWWGSEQSQLYGIDNPVENQLGTHEAFQQRFPGVGAYGETDALSDVLGRLVYGDEPSGEGPSRTVRPWEIENWTPLQGGEYAPWEGELYDPEAMNSTAFEPGLIEQQPVGLQELFRSLYQDTGFEQALPLEQLGGFAPAPLMPGPGGFAPAPPLEQLGGFTPGERLLQILRQQI